MREESLNFNFLKLQFKFCSVGHIPVVLPSESGCLIDVDQVMRVSGAYSVVSLSLIHILSLISGALSFSHTVHAIYQCFSTFLVMGISKKLFFPSRPPTTQHILKIYIYMPTQFFYKIYLYSYHLKDIKICIRIT